METAIPEDWKPECQYPNAAKPPVEQRWYRLLCVVIYDTMFTMFLKSLVQIYGTIILKTIYNAPSEAEGREALDEVTSAWEEKYPRAMKRWYDNWDAISPIFKFSADVRTVIYTTNAIESLNSTYRRLNSQRSVFPSDTALLKALYLSTFEATKKWNMPIRNWGKVYGELAIMYDGWLPD